MVTKTFNQLITNLKKKPTRYLIFLMIFLVIVCIYTTSLHIEKLDWLKDLFGEEEEPSTPMDVDVDGSVNSISSCKTLFKHFNPLSGLCETPTTEAQCIHFSSKIINPSPTPTTPCIMASQLVCNDTGRIFDSINFKCKAPTSLLECTNIGFTDYLEIEPKRCYTKNQVWCSSLTPKKFYDGNDCEVPTDNIQCESANYEEGWTYGTNPTTRVYECIPPLTMTDCRKLNPKQFLHLGICRTPTNDIACEKTFGKSGDISSTWDEIELECHFATPWGTRPIVKRVMVLEGARPDSPSPNPHGLVDSDGDLILVPVPPSWIILLKLKWDFPADARQTTFIEYRLKITYDKNMASGGFNPFEETFTFKESRAVVGGDGVYYWEYEVVIEDPLVINNRTIRVQLTRVMSLTDTSLPIEFNSIEQSFEIVDEISINHNSTAA